MMPGNDGKEAMGEIRKHLAYTFKYFGGILRIMCISIVFGWFLIVIFIFSCFLLRITTLLIHVFQHISGL